MKFYVHNVSARTHVLDRDIPAGAGVKPGVPAAEYTEEQFAKIAKPLSIAMQTMNHALSKGYNVGSDSVWYPGDSEFEVYADDEGEKGRMTVADVAAYGSEYAKKQAAEAEAKKLAEDTERAAFEAWKASGSPKAKEAEKNK